MEFFIKNKIKSIFKFVKKFYISVNWYESDNGKKIKIKKTKLIVLKSKHQALNTNLKEYFEKNNFKLKRFKKNIYFLVLVRDKNILSSGWIFFGKKWKIEEIDLNINLKDLGLLFDFETPKKFRNKGYYTLLLKLIRSKFYSKKLAIYSLSNNFRSNKGIEKAGFKFVKKIYGL